MRWPSSCLLKFTSTYLFLFWVSYASFSQDLNQTVILKKSEYKAAKLLDHLSDHYNIPFVFSPDVLKEVSIRVEPGNHSLQQLLTLLETYNLRYNVSSGQVMIGLKEEKQESGFLSIYGRVRDNSTGEFLIGANILVRDSLIGVVTNNYGHFSLSLPQGTHELVVSYVGYEPVNTSIKLNHDTKVTFRLNPAVASLNAVTVSDRSATYNIKNLTPGINILNLDTEGQVPYLLGEVDVLQGSLLLPGIRTLGEDANGLNIRGGAVDQNLVLLDEATVYNPNHFFGLFSVFNPEAVNQVKVMKGYIPPSYGGRASSVVAIHQKEGNNQRLRFSGGIGIVSARFTAEGPIKANSSSFLFSARQSLFDITEDGATVVDFFNSQSSNSISRNRTSFRDFNLKVNFKLNPQNTLFVSGYLGNDDNRAGLDARRTWGNQNLTMRWNHTFGERLFANYSVIISQYNYKITQPREAASFIGTSKIIDYSLKGDHFYYANPKSLFNFGMQATFHRLNPGDRIPFQEDSSSDSLFLDTEHGFEVAGFISHEWEIRPRLKLQYGFRYSTLANLGSGEVYQYASGQPRTDESIEDTTRFDAGEIIKFYHGIEPRVSINFSTGELSSLKASYTRNIQYLHLISNTISPTPTDIWKISDTYVSPTRSDQFSLGYYKNFESNKWETSIEAYYKQFTDIIDYKDGADLLFNPNPETELLTGDGRAYGLEIFVKRNANRFKGWLSYTFSRSERKVAGQFQEETINNGSYYPDDYDKTHDLSLVGIYEINRRLSISSTFNYSTGRPITLPIGKYEFEGTLVPHFENRNQSRITDYHRLDFSLKWDGKTIKKNGKPRNVSDHWTFTIYNAYARKNAFSYFFRESADNPGETEIVRYSVFGTIIPSVTYNFKF
ncbi:MAG: TonB-dependent receptor [Cyclobacteriaceae bacterium]|nr:TonB-dependent receptor [Cyclobacteriaceae bacterium HetDA_MAG_MS6]